MIFLANEEIMRLNAMFKGMVVDNFGPTRLRDETWSHLEWNKIYERF